MNETENIYFVPERHLKITLSKLMGQGYYCGHVKFFLVQNEINNFSGDSTHLTYT